jgi:hypothetical protein
MAKQKSYWRISSPDSPIGEYTERKKKFIGEYQLAFRQFTNIRLTFSNGECTIGETPYWRRYIDSTLATHNGVRPSKMHRYAINSPTSIKKSP